MIDRLTWNDVPLSVAEVRAAHRLLRRWRLVRGLLLTVAAVAAVVAAALWVPPRWRVQAARDREAAEVERWFATGTLPPGAIVHRGAEGDVVEVNDALFLVVHQKVVGRSQR